jgi:ribonuclease HI
MEELITHSTKYDLAIIQEPYTGNQNMIRDVNGVRIFQRDTTNNKIKAAIVVFNKNLTVKKNHIDNNNAYVDLQLNQETITIGSVYIEPSEGPENAIIKLTDICKTRKSIILGGDVNAKSIWWGCKRSDQKGQTICDALNSTQINMMVLNTGTTPTFETHRGSKYITSIIDITATSMHLTGRIAEWTVNRNIMASSDHNPITFKLNTTNPLEEKRSLSTRRYKTENADWPALTKSLTKRLKEENLNESVFKKAKTPTELNELVDRFVKLVQAVCDKKLQRKKDDAKRKPNIWWTKELSTLKKAAIKAKHKLQNSGKERREQITLPAYLEAKETYKEAVNTAKLNSWKEHCTIQTKETAWSAIHRVLATQNNRKVPDILKKNGTWCQSKCDTANALLEHFFKDDDPENENESHKLIRRNTHSLSFEMDKDFTTEEILMIADNMNPKKAPGPDYLTADICQRVLRSAPSLATEMYNACLRLETFPKQWKIARIVIVPKPMKDDYDEISAYRPIGLLPILGKILEKLMIDRIYWHLLQRNALQDCQYGFTPQRSTEDALNVAIEKIRYLKARKRKTIVISLDIEGAFDNAWWPLALRQLTLKRCPLNLHALMNDYLKDRSVQTSHSGDIQARRVTKGCIQGSTCGPVIWNIILDDLLAEKFDDNCHIQAYADDILLIVHGKDNTEAAKIANLTLDTVTQWGKKAKLNFSEKKTMAMWMHQEDPTNRLMMNDSPISIVKAVKTLGVTIDKYLKWNIHIDNICNKTAGLINALIRAAKPTWGCSPEVLRILYRGAIEPLVTYASSVWSEAVKLKKTVKKLNALQRPIAIRSCKGYRTVSLTSAQALAGFIPLDLMIAERAAMYKIKRTGTISDLPNDRLLQRPIPHKERRHPARHPELVILTDPDKTAAVDSDTADIYTDGSKDKTSNGKVGAAFVLLQNKKPKLSKKYLLENYCTVYQAETLAMLKALEWASRETSYKRVRLTTDSLSVVQSLHKKTTNPIEDDIKKLIIAMNAKGIKIEIAWTRAHSGNLGNDLADAEAKKATKKKTKPDYSMFPLSYAKQQLRHATMEAWNTRYLNSETGTVTKTFFDNIYTAQAFSKMNEVGYEVTQFLTGHGAFGSYLKRFKIIQDEECQCDNKTPQTSLHVLFGCRLFEDERLGLMEACKKHNPQDVSPRDTITHVDTARALKATAKLILNKLTN